MPTNLLKVVRRYLLQGAESEARHTEKTKHKIHFRKRDVICKMCKELLRIYGWDFCERRQKLTTVCVTITISVTLILILFQWPNDVRTNTIQNTNQRISIFDCNEWLAPQIIKTATFGLCNYGHTKVADILSWNFLYWNCSIVVLYLNFELGKLIDIDTINRELMSRSTDFKVFILHDDYIN